jgi:hypothetical protein
MGIILFSHERSGKTVCKNSCGSVLRVTRDTILTHTAGLFAECSREKAIS